MSVANESAQGADVQDVVRKLKEEGTKYVFVGCADVHGQMRGKYLPSWRFTKDPLKGVPLPDVVTIMAVDDWMVDKPANYEGWWPTWEEGFDDLEIIPDLATIRTVPWIDDGVILLGNPHERHADELETMPRNVLGRIVKQLDALGFEAKMAPELEFFIFRETPGSAKEKGYRDLTTMGEGVTAYGGERADADWPLLDALEQGLTGMGITIEGAMPEAGPSQYELNLTPQPAMRAADDAFLFKFGVKRIVESLGYMATFIPKLEPGGFGSSCHVHQSLWQDGVNKFYDPSQPDELSVLARQYIAGLTSTLREFTVLFAPFVTSYKRFEAGEAVGMSAAWGVGNRGVGVRAVTDGPAGTRIENRVPGSDANPYLCLAGLLAGGMYGIENDLDPGDPYRGNAYADPSLPVVPRTLAEAIDLFEQSEVANKYLGEETVRYIATTKKWEVESFNSAVTDWELARYFGKV